MPRKPKTEETAVTEDSLALQTEGTEAALVGPVENASAETEVSEASPEPDAGTEPETPANAPETDETETTPVLEPEAAPAKASGKASAAPKTATPANARRQAPSSILTLSADTEVETQESREDTLWHELQNAYRTRRILTGCDCQ